MPSCCRQSALQIEPVILSDMMANMVGAIRGQTVLGMQAPQENHAKAPAIHSFPASTPMQLVKMFTLRDLHVNKM